MTDAEIGDTTQSEESEELGELEPEAEARWTQLAAFFRWSRSTMAHGGRRIALAIAWLRRPDEVGQPITLPPRGVRLLLLLILGNLIVLVLLANGLYQAATLSTVKATPQVVVATPTLGPTSTPGPSPTPFGKGGAIAFTLRRNGDADVYALNQRERELVRLTYDPAEDCDPAWSPDGDYLAFSSNRADNWDIYLLDLISGALIRLTHEAGFDGHPSWSPDGRWIAYESYRRDNLDIYIMSTAGGQVQRLTTNPAPDYEPAWSPDSRAIAFTSFRKGNRDIYLYLVEEEESINVTNSPDMAEGNSAWSPDGMQLAYVSGPRGNPSIQVTTFDWDSMTADQTQTEIFGAGTSPIWSPDGQSLIYAYERGKHSHIIAASVKSWALFHEIYSIEEPLDDIAWTSMELSPRIVARAQADAPSTELPLYVEVVQPTPSAGPPHGLVLIPNVNNEGEVKNGNEGEKDEVESENEELEEEIEEETGGEREDGEAFLCDRVNESFNALRQRVIEEAGWDYLARLGLAQLPMDYTPYSGHSRMSWHVCGRAIGLDQQPYEEKSPRIELAREDVGNVTYWRVFIKAAKQDGSMGQPLREGIWNLEARQEDGQAMVEGGELKKQIPSGYYVDFTTLASDYGWERVPSLWRWRYFWPDIRWWRFRKMEDLTWWECMLEVFEPEEIEASFGPIPGYEN